MSFSTSWPDLGLATAAAMYWLGRRRRRTAAWRAAAGPARCALERWRTASFAAALLVLALALSEPMDGLADKLFWAHMVQHVLLLAVAAPLIVLAAPWMALWRALPLGLRRAVAGSLARGAWAAPLRALARVSRVPLVTFALLNVDVLAWHLPAAYDLTLRSHAAHYAEHASFLLLGVMGWAQVIDSPPYRSRLALAHRGAFALGAMIVGWLLALPLAFAKSPWYAPYAHLRHRPGGISALVDQHLAAGVMWVPASLSWSVAIFVLIYSWVSDREGAEKASRHARMAAAHPLAAHPLVTHPPARPLVDQASGDGVRLVDTARRIHA